MKRLYRFFLIVPVLLFCLIGLFSLFDKDELISEKENRGLAQKPALTMGGLLDGSYMEALDTYYTDQFPLREALLEWNASINGFYSFTGSGDGNQVYIQINNDAARGGGIGHTEIKTGGDGDAPSSVQTEDPIPVVEPSESPVAPASQTENENKPQTPVDPDFEDTAGAQTLSDMLYVNGRALEVVYFDSASGKKYAQAVDNLAACLPGVKTYSILTPNSAAFYAPQDIRDGSSTNQKTMIDSIYSYMGSNVITVDAYSKLRSHIDEYIFFRTDHHWTQRGAYYAYSAFCESAGLEAVPMSQFETGRIKNAENGHDTFLGTLYSYLDAYPTVRQEMRNNPDYCEYFFPIVKCDATAYKGLANGALYGANNGITTLAREIWDSYLYMGFICGDQPIEVIETEAESDRVCIVLKESYGNAFVPFLTTHFKRVVVVDPREFNTSSTPSLYLPDLAKLVGATDLIVINYPHMPNNSYYINRLNYLAGISPS